MKEVVIVSKGNNAVAYGAGIEIKKTASSGIVANLEVLNELLRTHISTESSETVRVFLMDLIGGINSGHAVEYVKTGKQINGETLAPDVLAGYTEFYNLYKDRLLNLRWNSVAYIPKMKDNKVYMDLRSKAYAILNSMPSTSYAPQVKTEVIDTHKELRQKLTDLMSKALDEGDFDKYDNFEARLNKLPKPEVVTVSGSGTSASQPKFETTEGKSIDTDLDTALTGNNTETENDKPIDFSIESAGNKPSWDGEDEARI